MPGKIEASAHSNTPDDKKRSSSSSKNDTKDIQAKLAKVGSVLPQDTDNNIRSIFNDLVGVRNNSQYQKRRQQEHDLRFELTPKVIKWVSRVFFPVIFLLVILSGVSLEYKGDGLVFTYAIPAHVLWVAISSTVISVATVSGFMFRWLFRRPEREVQKRSH